MSEVGCDIVEYLKEFHTSEGKAVKARELCVLFNVHEKQLRNIVSDRKRSGSLPKEATGKSNRTQVSYLRI